MPRVVSAGVPMRSPEGFIGGRGSKGIALRLTVIPTASSRSSAVWPSSPVGVRSTRTRWTSVPPVRTGMPSASRPAAKAWALAIVCRWRAANCSLAAIFSATALAAIVCISGPPCWPGKTALSIAFACSSRQRIMPLRGPQRVLWIVVVTTSACGDRVRVLAGGDEAGEVGHVDHQLGPDRVGDLAEGGEVELARVGGPAGDDQRRLVLLGEPRDLVHVDQQVLAADVVGRPGCRACRRR